jgi:polar amino acid transport system substrate-binding protein
MREDAMRTNPRNALSVGAVAILALLFADAANADKLDDILKAGKLRCGVMLDVPPIGYRDKDNNPVGYDVEICRDIAKNLGVQPQLVETPDPDRIPAVLSDRVDLSISGATNSLERAKVIAFSIPYQVWDYSVAVRADDNSIKTYDDVKGKVVGGVRGTTPELYFLNDYKKWNDPNGKYISYGSDAEEFLALKEGKVQAIMHGTVTLAQFIQQHPESNLKICCVTRFPQDWTGIMVKRNEQGLLNWINLFIWHEYKSGRIDELYRKWWGFPAPSMAWPGVSSY